MVESAKWQSWSQLGEMAPVEAMRLFMRLLESEQVNNNLGQLCHTDGQASLPFTRLQQEESPVRQEAVAVVHIAKLHHTCLCLRP